MRGKGRSRTCAVKSTCNGDLYRNLQVCGCVYVVVVVVVVCVCVCGSVEVCMCGCVCACVDVLRACLHAGAKQNGTEVRTMRANHAYRSANHASKTEWYRFDTGSFRISDLYFGSMKTNAAMRIYITAFL